MIFRIKQNGAILTKHIVTLNNSDLLIKAEPELKNIENITVNTQTKWIQDNINELRKSKRCYILNKVYDIQNRIFFELEE